MILKKDVEGFKAGDLLLLEHKTTTKVDEAISSACSWTASCCLYVLFLARELGAPIAGCLFNVILKPSIRQKKERKRGRIRPAA